MVEQVRRHAADLPAEQFEVQRCVRATAEVDRGEGQRLVQGHVGRAGPDQPGLVPQRLRERFAQGNAAILNGVVLVNVQVANSANLKVEHAVLRDVAQHVVEKPDTGLRHELPRPIEVQDDLDARLGGLARNGGDSWGHDSSLVACSTSRSAASSRSVSSGRPALMRM